MTVKQLIEQLQNCPQDLTVMMYYDGAPRLMCDSAFLSEKEVTYDESCNDTVFDVLVLCEDKDVYNRENYGKWFFKGGKT
jgi:hypothetical protein